jgi:hypothetical protein
MLLINKSDQKQQDLKSKDMNKIESINSALIKPVVVNKNQMTSTSFRIDDIISNNNKTTCENNNEQITNSMQLRYSNSFMSTLSSLYDSSCFFPPHSINKTLPNQQSLMPLIYNSI